MPGARRASAIASSAEIVASVTARVSRTSLGLLRILDSPLLCTARSTNGSRVPATSRTAMHRVSCNWRSGEGASYKDARAGDQLRILETMLVRCAPSMASRWWTSKTMTMTRTS